MKNEHEIKYAETIISTILHSNNYTANRHYNQILQSWQLNINCKNSHILNQLMQHWMTHKKSYLDKHPWLKPKQGKKKKKRKSKQAFHTHNKKQLHANQKKQKHNNNNESKSPPIDKTYYIPNHFMIYHSDTHYYKTKYYKMALSAQKTTLQELTTCFTNIWHNQPNTTTLINDILNIIRKILDPQIDHLQLPSLPAKAFPFLRMYNILTNHTTQNYA